RARNLPRAATRLYADAFAADAKLADDLGAAHRYSGACAAALASAGQGKDAGTLDEKERARLRQVALDWLQADPAPWRKRLQAGKPADGALARRVLSHWQKDSDLTGIRDKESLAKLPAEEHKAFTQLWADVAALLKKAEAQPKGGK